MSDCIFLHNGDALTELKRLPSELVDCVICSPPYWGLRDYKTEGQIGLEPTFEEYINKLIAIFSEVKRVLKKEGSCWVVLGDTYSGMKVGNTNNKQKNGVNTDSFVKQKSETIPEKSLCMIPSRFAISMIDSGWILRNDIIWHKPNGMPSSAKDRFTIDYEHVFFFTKSQKYYFETQYEQLDSKPHKPGNLLAFNHMDNFKNTSGYMKRNLEYMQKHPDRVWYNSNGRIKRSVWKITTQPYKMAHFAVYPEKLIEIPVKATCPEFICDKCNKPRNKIIESVLHQTRPGNHGKDSQLADVGHRLYSNLDKRLIAERTEKGLSDCGCNTGFHGGIVLDCFMGSGTTGLVAIKNARNFIGIEINADYIRLAEKRLEPYIKQEKLVLT